MRPSYRQLDELRRMARCEKRAVTYRIGCTNRTAAAMERRGWIVEIDEPSNQRFMFMDAYVLTDAGRALIAPPPSPVVGDLDAPASDHFDPTKRGFNP